MNSRGRNFNVDHYANCNHEEPFVEGLTGIASQSLRQLP